MKTHDSRRPWAWALCAAAMFLLPVASGCEATCPWDEDEVPSILSLSSSADTVLPGETLDLTIEVSFFELRGEEGHHDDEGEDDEDHEDHDHGDHDHSDTSACLGGHWHIYLDDLLTDPLGMPVTETETVTIPVDTEAGEHTLIARLHNEDHTILVVGDSEVTAEVPITVEAPAVPGR